MASKIKSLMLLLYILSMFFGCQISDHEIIIVPRDYRGYALIIYGQTDGADERYRNGSRVYDVPSNGILVTQFLSNPGWSEFPEFYYDSIAPENKISFVADFKNVPKSEVVAFGGSAGGANRDLAGKDVIRFKEYFIGNKLQIQKSVTEAEKLDIAKLLKQ